MATLVGKFIVLCQHVLHGKGAISAALSEGLSGRMGMSVDSDCAWLSWLSLTVIGELMVETSKLRIAVSIPCGPRE